MDIKKLKTDILESLKKLTFRELVYPGMLVFVFGIIVVVFFFSARFISKNINAIFLSENDGEAQALNIKNWLLAAKKLNIATQTEQQSKTAAVEPQQSATTTVETIATVNATSTPPQVLDKQAITILVRNSTEKSGLAKSLAKILENNGFKKPKTGDEKKLYATTTVFVKESKYDYAPLLLELIQKTYPGAISTTTPENKTYDATIIIGSR